MGDSLPCGDCGKLQPGGRLTVGPQVANLPHIAASRKRKGEEAAWEAAAG
jgi:hypothetical protein